MSSTTFRTGIGNNPAIPTVDFKTCDLCGACVRVCSTGLTIKNGKVIYDPESTFACVGCGQCMAACPTGSITVTGRRLSPDNAIPIPTADRIASTDQLESLLLKRRSVRNFERKAVDKELIDRIIQVASTAPTGLTPSDVGIIVLGGKSLKEFREDMLRNFKGVSRFMFNPVIMSFMRIFSKKENYETMRDLIAPVIESYLEDWKRKVDSFLYNCPVLMIFHVSPYGQKEDPLIAATYAMIAAESLGLGSCINGMIGPFLGRNKKLKRKYRIPEENHISIALMIGHPTIKYHKALRRDFSSVKHFT